MCPFLFSCQFLGEVGDEDGLLEAPLRGAVTSDYRRESSDEVTVSSLRMEPLSDLFVLPPGENQFLSNRMITNYPNERFF